MTTSSRSNRDASRDEGREAFVKRSALEVGFSRVGVADLEPNPESNRVFDRWIRECRHGDMRYLSGGADKRYDPRVLLGGAQSAICVAAGYFSRSKHERNQSAPRDGRGVVAMYAHGRDYHTVLGEMLQELVRRLEKRFAGIRTRAVVDTQPISERDLAIRAGVGWLGKNSCIISPDYGSWIFLAELITDLQLRADKPLETLCGSCTACIDACPAGAIVEPFQVDSNRCISYLTIEKRGEIPDRFHRLIGTRIFGCDTCQTVCPFNATGRESAWFDADDVNPLIERPLSDLVSIADEDFRRLTRDSAVARCKPEGMRRNAGIAAANLARNHRRG